MVPIDKQKHFMVGLILSLATGWIHPAVGLIIPLFAAWFKEYIYDKKVPGHTTDPMDMAYTVFGACVGFFTWGVILT